jgi:hypothetical protein
MSRLGLAVAYISYARRFFAESDSGAEPNCLPNLSDECRFSLIRQFRLVTGNRQSIRAGQVTRSLDLDL